MTLDAKMPLCCKAAILQGLLPNAPFTFIEVPELASGNHFLKFSSGRNLLEQLSGKLGVQNTAYGIGLLRIHRAQYGVGAQTCDLSANITNGGIHRVCKRVAGVAANDQSSLLRHESGHVSAVSGRDDNTAFHRDAEASRRVTMNHNSSTSQCCARAAARMAAHAHASR